MMEYEAVALRFGPGEEAHQYEVGDFLLTHSDKLLGRLIRFGQANSMWGTGREYAYWNHVAVIGDEDGTLLEALLPGIVRTHISDYEGQEYYVVKVAASLHDRAQMEQFLWSAFHARTRYGFLTIASIVLTLLTGTRLVFGWAGTAICSGYWAEAGTRAGYVFPKPPSYMTPGDLAMMFNIPGHPR